MNEENVKNESMSEPEASAPENTDVEETVEAATAEQETVEEPAAEEAHEGGIYVDETAEDENAEGDKEEEAEKKPGLSNKIIIAVAAGVVVIAVIVALVLTGRIGGGSYNKYNRMYMDIYGEYAGDFAESQGMEYDEFLEYYRLPADMPKDTNINAVQNLMPLGRYLELFGSGYTLDVMKEQMGWDDSITEETTIGEALDSTTLRYYVGEEQFDSYKEYYGLGDDVTLDTTWGEIRNTVDKKNKEDYEEQKALAEAEAEAEANGGADEAPADTEADDSAE